MDKQPIPWEQAFAPFSHYPETLVRRFCGGRYDEDMAQMARIACYTSYTSHYEEGKGCLSTFFYNAIRNAVHNAIRVDVRNREREGARVTEWEPDNFPDSEELTERVYLSAEVARAMNALNERERRVCTLHYYADKTSAEISVILRIGRSSVSNSLSSGTRKLREELAACYSSLSCCC